MIKVFAFACGAGATIGDVDANLAKYNAGDRLVPIRVRLRSDARNARQDLEQLPFALGSNADGSAPSAGDVVDRVWPDDRQDALSILRTLREPDAAMAARTPTPWSSSWCGAPISSSSRSAWTRC